MQQTHFASIAGRRFLDGASDWGSDEEACSGQDTGHSSRVPTRVRSGEITSSVDDTSDITPPVRNPVDDDKQNDAREAVDGDPAGQQDAGCRNGRLPHGQRPEIHGGPGPGVSGPGWTRHSYPRAGSRPAGRQSQPVVHKVGAGRRKAHRRRARGGTGRRKEHERRGLTRRCRRRAFCCHGLAGRRQALCHERARDEKHAAVEQGGRRGTPMRSRARSSSRRKSTGYSTPPILAPVAAIPAASGSAFEKCVVNRARLGT